MKNNKGLDLLADYVFLSKYSQKKADGNLETWEETIDRIYSMHIKKLASLNLLNEKTSEYLEIAKDLEYKKVILSSQRGRQFASPKETEGILKHEAKIYNCSSTLIDRIDVFGEIMYLLLCGCGVGYSLHKEYTSKLPSVKSPIYTKHHIINDSIEGWGYAINLLMLGAFEGVKVEFDFTEIRPEGALINNKFVAPGPEPLRLSINNIKKILKRAEGRQLTTLELHDIICWIAKAVVSGGVRRSALIALFDKDDYSMLTCKTGNWWEENPQRAMANNSILNSFQDKLSHKELKAALQVVRQFGEPGIINVPSYRYTLNPCAEIVMNPISDRGETGFAFCNLAEINAEKIKTEEEFFIACKAASFITTVQALYTDFKFLSSSTREIAERDRAIGVSITGLMMQNVLKPHILSKGAKLVVDTNINFAKDFNINPSKRSTTIKPSGNASAILGLHCSGIHPAHAHKYLRRVRIKNYSPEFLALENTPLVKTWIDDEAIISFPIESNDTNLTIKDDIDAVEHLKYIAMVKHYWVNKGVISGNIPNNVSATVEVCNTEWDEVAACLFLNDHLYTGVSLLPSYGDTVYDNAPFQRLSTQETQDEFNAIKEYLDTHYVDFNAIMSGRADIIAGDMAAVGCSGGKCELF